MSKLAVEMLPASEGDCLLLEYAHAAKPSRTCRVLIDGGRRATWTRLKERIGKIPSVEREFELLVITHVDRDHIEGVLTMLKDPECPIRFKDIWFNGYCHLSGQEGFGPVEGEELTSLIKDKLPWNDHAKLSHKAVCVEENADPPTLDLDGGLSLTVLSPTRAQLCALLPVWEQACEEADIVPNKKPPEPQPGEEPFGAIDIDALASEPFESDSKEANGSSIALLARYEGHGILLSGDAFPGVIDESLVKLFGPGPVALDAVKVAHHGSKHNTSSELIARLDCRRYLVSTSGVYFKHPDRQAIARILKAGNPDLLAFNYPGNPYSKIWKDNAGCETRYGTSEAGLRISLA